MVQGISVSSSTSDVPSWGSIAKLLSRRRPQPPPSRKQSALFVEALSRPGSEEHESCLSSQSWAPEMVWSSAAAEKAIETITGHYDLAIKKSSRPSTSSSRPAVRSAPQIVDSEEPPSVPTRPIYSAPSSSRSSSRRKNNIGDAGMGGLDVFKPHSPISAEAQTALDSMARIGDRPFQPPKLSITPTSLQTSSPPCIEVKDSDSAVGSSPSPGEPAPGIILQDLLSKIYTRTAALKAIEAATLDDQIASVQTDDPLGLSVLSMGVGIQVLGITGKPLTQGHKPYVDLDGMFSKLHRPPSLLSAPREETKKSPRVEYVLDQIHPVDDLYDWSNSDIFVCALDADMDQLPLELTLLLKDIGVEEHGGVDRIKFIKALNLLLHMHNELRCPQHHHEMFWAAHASNKPGTFVSIVNRLAVLNSARSSLMALMRALAGRACPADRELAAAQKEKQRLEKLLELQLRPESTSLIAGISKLTTETSQRPGSTRSMTRPVSTAVPHAPAPDSPVAAAASGKRPMCASRSSQSHLIRAGAARAVDIARKLPGSTAIEDPSNQPGRREQTIAEMLAKMEQEENEAAKADAKKVITPSSPHHQIGGWGRLRVAVTAVTTMKSLSRMSQLGPLVNESAEPAAEAGATNLFLRDNLAPHSPNPRDKTVEGDVPLVKGSVDMSRSDLVQALVDNYARSIPWPISGIKFAGQVYSPTKSTFSDFY